MFHTHGKVIFHQGGVKWREEVFLHALQGVAGEKGNQKYDALWRSKGVPCGCAGRETERGNGKGSLGESEFQQEWKQKLAGEGTL